jgi:hypothetical protein
MSQKVEWSKVVSVELDGEEECVCIAVGDGSRLYATGSGILTHNTTPPAPTGMARQYVAVKGALDNLRDGMKLVKSTDDERTIGGARVADTQYQTRSFEDMRPLAEMVVDAWVNAEMSGPDVLALLRTGDHTASGQRLEPGERILILNSLFETGRFRDFGVLQSDLSRVVQEITGDSGFVMRAAQEILDPIVKMKAEADAEVDAEISEVVGIDKDELVAELGETVNADQVAELEKVIRELQDEKGDLQERLGRDTAERKKRADEVARLRKLLADEKARAPVAAPVDVSALTAQISELEAKLQTEVVDRVARTQELARLKNLLALEEAKVKELEARPASPAEANQRLADEVVKSREKIRDLTKQLAEAETLFAQAEVAPATAKALENFNKWIMGEKVAGVPSIEQLAKKYLTLSRFNREGFKASIRKLFPALNEDVLDLALDRIVEELEGKPEVKPGEKKPVVSRTRGGGVVSAKGNLEKAEKSLRQLYEEDGAKRLTESFFRGGDKNTGTKAPLGEGNSLLNAELTRILNESLDALGIERKTMPKNPQDVFRQVAVTIGLDNLRDGKMREIDERVRLAIEERAGDNSELAQDMIDQWEQISASMLDSTVSGTIARRMSHLLLGERNTSAAELAGKSDAEVKMEADAIGREAAKRVAAINPAMGGVTPEDIANVQASVSGTVLALVERVRDARKKADALRRSPAQISARAQKIADRLAADFSDTPAWGKKATPDAVRALVTRAIGAKAEVTDLREQAEALGVSSEVAGQLVMMVMEARRRRESIATAAKVGRLAEARRKAIARMIDKLEGRVKPKHHASLGKFLGSLQRASDWGILDADVFSQAFAHSFGLNGMTPARVQQLHKLWHQLRNGGTYGMVRETLEREFLNAVNAVSPASRWDNALFSAFMSKVLSSFSSIVNQFDGVTRVLSPLSAITNAYYTGDPASILSNYGKGLSRLVKGLPFWLTGVKGQSLGHLPSEIGPSFKPGEMQLNRLAPGSRFRVKLPGGRVVQLSPTATNVLRWMELYSWRAIRGAEGLVGSAVDARSSYQDALTNHYRSTGMKPADARRQALRDIAASPADITGAEAQAKSEQASGMIGTGAHVLQRRVEEIVQNLVDTRLGTDAAERAAQFTAYMNFKTDPVGPFGFIANQIVKQFIPSVDGQASGIGRVARFWLMFPRFFGNLVDRSVGYVPGLHLLNRITHPMVDKKIVEIFGSKQNYNRFNDARAGAGLTVALMAGGLLALSKALKDDEEDEPWFDITGSLPSASREEKARLKAAGKWSETTLKIGGVKLNYASFGELSPVLTMIGNVNDYMTHGSNAGEFTTGGAGYQVVADTVMAPVRRSTYRQWLQLAANLGGSANAQQGEAGFRNLFALLVQPIGGALKVPIVTDLDRLTKGGDALVARSLGDKMLAKIPFVKIGDVLITPYGERVPGLPFLAILGDGESSSDVLRAARINLDTGTMRAVPQAPDVAVDDAQAAVYQELAGKLYTSTLLKNEKRIREKLKAGDTDEVEYIIRTISAMSNASAKSQTWPEVYGVDAKKAAMKAAMQERKEDKRARRNDAASTEGFYILPP